jgi:hypothetical protein
MGQYVLYLNFKKKMSAVVYQEKDDWNEETNAWMWKYLVHLKAWVTFGGFNY